MAKCLGSAQIILPKAISNCHVMVHIPKVPAGAAIPYYIKGQERPSTAQELVGVYIPSTPSVSERIGDYRGYIFSIIAHVTEATRITQTMERQGIKSTFTIRTRECA